ncbi:MAG TPA: RluA family pseudouridine synthase [Marinobacterium sp.]|nr:RluA family pseudouridine synthase [Marinobacterium sp.]
MKVQQNHLIDATNAGQIASDFLAEKSGLSKQKIKDAMTKGAIWLKRHNKPRRHLRRAKEVLQNRDRLEIFYDEALLSRKVEGALCLHDASGYSVWFKPAGAVAQGNDWCDHLSIQRIAEQTLEPKRTAFVVHRLDRETAGLMLLAHSKGVAANLSEQFQKRDVTKHYLCQVRGETPLSGEIDAKLDGKAAQTLYKRLSYDSASNTSWLNVEILSGRTHQIRRHLEQIAHPVMGDPKYGRGNKNSLGLQLFAVKLAFTCPVSRELKTFELSQEFLQQHGSIACETIHSTS